jgi:hypothetical protein
MVTARSPRDATVPFILLAEGEVVQTNAYMGNDSILEAPIAPELFGRI